jgi:TMEM175 potassium channel family protein
MSAEPGSRHRQDGEQPSIGRLLSLSDGVVAIALTLLVLQLRVPPVHELTNQNSASELAAQLGNGGDRLVSYVISFYVIAQFWLIHHRVFRQIGGHQEGLAWWNFAFLFTITVMPFTSDLLGSYAENPLAVDIFAFNLLLASLATLATLKLGERRGLLTRQATRRSVRVSELRSFIGTVILAGSMGVAWVNPDAAKYFWLLIAVVPGAATRWYERRTRAAQPTG